MLTLIFVILMFAVFGKILHLAFKFAWGMTKIVFTLIFLPFIIIGIAIAGFMTVAIAILIIAGFFAFISSLVLG